MKKKVLLGAFVALLVLACVAVVGVWSSITHVRLPHGAVLHVLPAFAKNQYNEAVIICPGGGYRSLEKWNEGYMWFPFFYTRGYAVALLEYRMPNHDCESPFIDGSEAVREMRKHAEEWHFAPNKLGIMGFSAGGHVASTMLVANSASVRPDFGILFYPVISMMKELAHQGSHDRLLGADASPQLEAQYSNEQHVSEQTPSVYIAVSHDDMKVNPQNAFYFYDAMRAKSRPVTLQEYPTGGHGWGYRLTFEHHRQMLDDLSRWLSDKSKQ